VYGEKQNIADRYRNVVGIFMNQALMGKPMTVFGDGSQTRVFSYIDDVAPIIARAPLVPKAYQKTFNIGADQPCTVILLAEKVAAALGVAHKIIHLPPRNEVLHAFASHDRLRQVFNPSEPVPLEAGLRRMSDWVRQSGPRPPVRFGNIEVRRELPPSWLLED
jgi:UDP-glucose 4-epimerase